MPKPQRERPRIIPRGIVRSRDVVPYLLTMAVVDQQEMDALADRVRLGIWHRITLPLPEPDRLLTYPVGPDGWAVLTVSGWKPRKRPRAFVPQNGGG